MSSCSYGLLISTDKVLSLQYDYTRKLEYTPSRLYALYIVVITKETLKAQGKRI